MKLAHIAIWVEDLEGMKSFYVENFCARPGARYDNPSKGFASYFLSFKESLTRIELMTKTELLTNERERGFSQGLAHMAFTVNNREEVVFKTDELRTKGIRIASEPRLTGDGYYESAVLDLEGNYIEICSQ